MSRRTIRAFAVVLALTAVITTTGFRANAATASAGGRSVWLQWGHDAGHTSPVSARVI